MKLKEKQVSFGTPVNKGFSCLLLFFCFPLFSCSGYSLRESNSDLIFRRDLFYPLN